MPKRQILLTNDDGIRSPGLWAAAEALSALGFVTVAAPREQSSGMGRSLPGTSDGTIVREKLHIKDQDWEVFAIGGTPAQAVQHGILEIMPYRPDLVVSGINYGENIGTGVSISGTVGAALEAGSYGIPALAISLETEQQHHLSYSTEVDFSAAAHFSAYFARMLLERRFPGDVYVLKVDVPSDASKQTDWTVTRVSPQRYYDSTPPGRAEADWAKPARMGYRVAANLLHEPEDTDVFALRKRRIVSVTPLSLDMTARVGLHEFEQFLRKDE